MGRKEKTGHLGNSPKVTPDSRFGRRHPESSRSSVGAKSLPWAQSKGSRAGTSASCLATNLHHLILFANSAISSRTLRSKALIRKARKGEVSPRRKH